MFTFIKKLFGFDQPTMKEAGVQLEQAPYKVETPVVDLAAITTPQSETVNPQCSDSITQPDGNECKAFPTAVNDQITDAVTQAPAKKPRNPRAPKETVTEKSTTKKAALVKKAAAIKATTKARTSRSKKA
jgi:hypothetical protein